MSNNKKKSGRSLTKLALFEERDKMHPRNETYEGIENFTGLVKKRSKTDLCCLIFYIIANTALIGLFYYTYSTHDFTRLSAEHDFRGDICGKEGTTVEKKPYVYYEDPENIGPIGMCVAYCPESNGQEMCFYDVDGKTLLDDYCYFSYTTATVGKVCLPLEMGQNRTIIESKTKSNTKTLINAAGDILKVWDVFFIAYFIILVFGAGYIAAILIQKARKIVLIGIVIGSGILGVNLVAFFYMDYQNEVKKYCILGKSENGCAGLRGVVLLCLALTTIFALISFYFYLFKNRKRLRLTVHRENAEKLFKPILQIKTMFVFLLAQYVIQFIIVAFYIASFIITMASGDLTLLNTSADSDFPNTTYFAIRPPSSVYLVLIFQTFMFFWNLGNTLIFGRMVLTSAIATWYFSREKSILDLPIWRGLKYTLRFHVGTIAYGALCVAINWPFKSFFNLIRYRLKQIRNRKSRTFRFWMSSCNLTLSLYEYVLKYVSNKNFMQTAIFGEEFGVAGVRVFYLKYRNESRLKLLKNTIGFYLMIGKFFITMATTAYVYNFVLVGKKTVLGEDLEELEFSYVPAIFIFIITLFISQTFTSLFDVVTDAMLFCFICDEEMYTGKQRFGEQELRDFMDLFGKESKKQDDDLDVRARPKHFQEEQEEEHSINEDDVFAGFPKDEKKDKNKDKDKDAHENDAADQEEDEEHNKEYKALHVDDAVSDNAVSASDITARSNLQLHNNIERKTGDLSGFNRLNFGMFANQEAEDYENGKAKKKNGEEDDEDDEEGDEDEEGEEEEEEDEEERRRREEAEAQQDDNHLDVSHFGGRNTQRAPSQTSEDEEDLEINNAANAAPVKKQNFLF